MKCKSSPKKVNKPLYCKYIDRFPDILPAMVKIRDVSTNSMFNSSLGSFDPYFSSP